MIDECFLDMLEPSKVLRYAGEIERNGIIKKKYKKGRIMAVMLPEKKESKNEDGEGQVIISSLNIWTSDKLNIGDKVEYESSLYLIETLEDKKKSGNYIKATGLIVE